MGELVSMPVRDGGDPLLTKRQLAAELNMSESWINLHMRESGLPYRKMGPGRFAAVRFRKSEVEGWVRRMSA